MPTVPLAYKFVATAVMLLEVNHCASRLHLPVNLPIQEQDVRVAVFPPGMIGFAGRMDTTNFSFSFAKSGRLRFITRLDQGYQAYSATKSQGDLRTPDFLKQLAGIPSTMDTNGAYRLASNWLASIEVDVAKLERKYPAITKQWVLVDKYPVPIFEVIWGTDFSWQKTGPKGGPVVNVMIDGNSKALLHLRQEDDSYSGRPASLIKDVDKLLVIPDVEFLKYSPLERSNLVARFTAVDYSMETNTSGSSAGAQSGEGK